MAKDRRYETAKNLILGGYMKTINELFDVVPKTTVATDLHINLKRLNKLILHPMKYGFTDMVKLATLLDVDIPAVMNLVYNQYQTDKKRTRKVRN